VLTRTLVVGFGCCFPAWMAWDLVSPKGIILGFLSSLVAFACGWYVSRQFVRDYFDV